MISRKRRKKIFTYAALVILSAVYLVPAYMVLVTSFKSPDQINMNTVWDLPEKWFPQSFADAWEAFAPSLLNSFMMVIPSTLI